MPREPRDRAPIVVTAVGMRTPIGNDAVQTASAARAQINRFARWEQLGAAFEEEAGVTASFLPEDLGDGAWVEKANELTPAPMHEALWQAELFDLMETRRSSHQGRVAAYVATPYPDRAGVAREAFRRFAAEAKENCIAPARADEVHLVPGDHAAGLMALAQAANDLAARRFDVAVVGGADSLLHTEFLQALMLEGRLKLPTRADGLIPGEAAAVLVLERAQDAHARGARPLGRLGPVVVETESTPIGPEHPIRAEGASRAVRGALAGIGAPGQIERVIVDLTGERWRSLEWALVETRCLGELPHGWQLWHPADCLGDVGAASALVNVGLALRSFERGYGGKGGALVSAASPRGERAAVCVFPGEGRA